MEGEDNRSRALLRAWWTPTGGFASIRRSRGGGDRGHCDPRSLPSCLIDGFCMTLPLQVGIRPTGARAGATIAETIRGGC